MSTTTLFWLGVSILFEVVGDVGVKKASTSDSPLWWVFTLFAYNLMLAAWFLAIANAKNITLPGIVWLLCGQVALVVVGCGVFHELLTPLQWAGVALAAIALLLLSL